ncbi:MAG: endopeptidase La [Anaerorhabdus sp.]
MKLPILCTRGNVVFPDQEITIVVKREQSIKTLEYSKNELNKHIFVVSQISVSDEEINEKNLYNVGTICKIKTMKYSEKHNAYLVKLHGIKRGQLSNKAYKDSFLFGDVKELKDIGGDQKTEGVLVKRILKMLEEKGSITTNIPLSEVINIPSEFSASFLTNQYCQYLMFSFKKQQKMLETLNVNDRLNLIIEDINTDSEFDLIEKEINKKVNTKMADGQREYFLREKMKIIKEELGDISNVSDDITDLREKLEKNPYPANVKKKALEEIKRYEMLPAASGESAVVRGYLDWLFNIPWYEKTEDNNNLEDVQKSLDKDHFGLSKVKERIMEYLAVKEMTSSLKAPILCLVGPPGVGKTSLAKSIANAMHRKFVKMSLGGVKDESEIRGHRRTYLGSMPGRIIQGMKNAEVINPVFLIDEIDKLGSDYKGDPSSALLEVLDPEQNKMFSDHYLEEPYDLSEVMFIATANYLENIPVALQDRLEIINLSSYTEIEKIDIALNHLVKRQVKQNGLKMSQFKITDKEILHLIRHYTREAGVRQLERLIGTLCRKTVLAVLKDKKKQIKVSKKIIQEWLGNNRFEYGSKEKKDQIGVVTGLAYTSFGGDVLPVEVTYFDGSGKFVVTGYLGDVMKESTSIALDYIKSNAKKYHIDPVFFEKHDIHIHVPEGAVPKDGPSAGITLTTAIISAITKTPVSSKISMTGEVTLRGRVLAIGGLREKSLAAHRVGIRTVIMPKTNLKDIDEFPEILKSDMQFIPVETMDDVLRVALT